MRDSIKHKIHRLIRAINEALSESDDISDSLDGVRDEGYDLFLILEATVVLNRDGTLADIGDDEWDEEALEWAEEEEWLEEEDDLVIDHIGDPDELRTEITESDHEFLRELEIHLQEEE